MNEQYYDHIPDLNAYYERIGLDMVKEATLENLDNIIYGHQTHIPFEDIDPYMYKKNVSLDINDLFKKMVTDKRGGFCFEMNALLCQVLLDTGYDAIPVFCRIIRNNKRENHPAILHRGTVVNIDNELYFCDVGYGGPMPCGALPLSSKDGRIMHGEKFMVDRIDDKWLTVSRITSKGEKEEIMDFILMPQENVDFISPSYFCSTHPNSIFTKLLLVNLRTETGSKSITDKTFTVVENGVSTSKEIETDEELKSILKSEFLIELA